MSCHRLQAIPTDELDNVRIGLTADAHDADLVEPNDALGSFAALHDPVNLDLGRLLDGGRDARPTPGARDPDTLEPPARRTVDGERAPDGPDAAVGLRLGPGQS